MKFLIDIPLPNSNMGETFDFHSVVYEGLTNHINGFELGKCHLG